MPSLTADGGVDDVTKGKEFGKKKHDEYTELHYHQPSDEYDAKTWDLTGGIQDIGLVYLIGKKLAFSDVWPQWKTGSEFKTIRDQSAQERK